MHACSLQRTGSYGKVGDRGAGVYVCAQGVGTGGDMLDLQNDKPLVAGLTRFVRARFICCVRVTGKQLAAAQASCCLWFSTRTS